MANPAYGHRPTYASPSISIRHPEAHRLLSEVLASPPGPDFKISLASIQRRLFPELTARDLWLGLLMLRTLAPTRFPAQERITKEQYNRIVLNVLFEMACCFPETSRVLGILPPKEHLQERCVPEEVADYMYAQLETWIRQVWVPTLLLGAPAGTARDAALRRLAYLFNLLYCSASDRMLYKATAALRRASPDWHEALDPRKAPKGSRGPLA